MKVRLLSTGKILNAKYFKDMTEEEKRDSLTNIYNWDDDCIFVEPCDCTFAWSYMFEEEIERIEDDLT